MCVWGGLMGVPPHLFLLFSKDSLSPTRGKSPGLTGVQHAGQMWFASSGLEACWKGPDWELGVGGAN